MTTVTKVGSGSFRPVLHAQHIFVAHLRVYVSFVLQYVQPPGERYYNTLFCCKEYVSSSSVVSHTFSVLCMYSKFRHHPHPLGYTYAKFCLFHNPPLLN